MGNGDGNMDTPSQSPPASSASQAALPSGNKSSEAAESQPTGSVTSSAADAADRPREQGEDTNTTPNGSLKCITDNIESILFPELSNMQDTASEICRCIREGIDVGATEIAECFIHASVHPPITLESLTELDMTRIINNPKLRHDVNFDRELHFRPNLDGAKGREKMKQAEDYWKALEGELFMYARVQRGLFEAECAQAVTYWTALRAASEKRLPTIFEAIRDILQTLVPDYDQEAVKHRLDANLTMQEIKNGVCDLIDLADWLAKILKNHCAPMRDGLVDRMRDEIVRGAVEGRANTLVLGIRQLLNILEAMKLDVANHQIRHMRPLLIEDTINFQRRYNAHRISMEKIDVTRARNWLECEIATMTGSGDTPSSLEALTSGLLRSLLNNGANRGHPQTFYLDSDRLKEVKNDMHSSIFHDLIRDILHETTLQHSLSRNAFDEITASLKTKITDIVGAGCKFVDRIEYVAAELMRFVLKIEGNDATTTDPELLSYLEDRLLEDLRPNSPAFDSHARTTFERILPKLQNSVAAHVKLPAVPLHDRLVPALPPKLPPIGMGAVCAPPVLAPLHPDDEIVRRLTHMIVLHWQVWADLVYLAVPEDDPESESSSGGPTPPSSRSPSPTVPVAEAIFGPGRRWLPIGVTIKDIPSRHPSPSDPDADAPAGSSESAANGHEQQGGAASSGKPRLDSEK